MFKFEKFILLRKIRELRVPYTKKRNDNSGLGVHSFKELLKSLLTLWILEEIWTWTMFSKLKALADWENPELSFFQYSAKKKNTITRNSEFSLPSIIPYVKVKFRLIIFGNRAKNSNSELGYHLTGNYEISEFSANSELLLWPNLFKVVRNKKLKILIIDNFFSCHLMIMKLCTVIELGNAYPRLKSKFL